MRRVVRDSSSRDAPTVFAILPRMTAETTKWRLIIDGGKPGAVNMARDVAILEAVSTARSLPTLRLYGWNPPCLTLGRHQGVEAADLEFCRREGIDVVRRPTGGRALLHHLELTYAVIAPLGSGPLPRPLQDAYRLICAALVQAMRTIGVDAALTDGEVNVLLPSPRSAVPCFKAPAGGEVVVGGRKLIGSAMRSHAGTILQHGSILLEWDGRLQAGAMGLADDSGLRPFITTLADELDRLISRANLADAVVDSCSEVLGVSFRPEGLTIEEDARQQDLGASFAVTG
jgi:lipoate-protein ligase A